MLEMVDLVDLTTLGWLGSVKFSIAHGSLVINRSKTRWLHKSATKKPHCGRTNQQNSQEAHATSQLSLLSHMYILTPQPTQPHTTISISISMPHHGSCTLPGTEVDSAQADPHT